MRKRRRIEPLLISMMCLVARRRLDSVFWLWYGTGLYLNLNLIALLSPSPSPGLGVGSRRRAGFLLSPFSACALLYALTCEIRGVGSGRLPLTKSFSRLIILRLNAFQFKGRSGPVGQWASRPVCLLTVTSINKTTDLNC
jgi:hypothetical protein